MTEKKYQKLIALFALVQHWGISKGISRAENVKAQYEYLHQELSEVQEALKDFNYNTRHNWKTEDSLNKLKNEIGDTIVTLVLLQECTHKINYDKTIVNDLNEIKDFERTIKEYCNSFQKDLINFRWYVSPYVKPKYLLAQFIGICLAHDYDVVECLKSILNKHT